MRHLTRTYEVPGTVWLGLLAFPVVWGLLMLAYPDAGYQVTPIWVNGTGLIVAWLAVGRGGRADQIHRTRRHVDELATGRTRVRGGDEMGGLAGPCSVTGSNCTGG